MQSTKALRVAAVVAGLAIGAAACGGSSGGSGSTGSGGVTKGTENKVAVSEGGTITYASEKNPTNFNILTSDGNTFDTVVMVNGVYPAAFIAYPDLSVKVNKDLLTSAQLTKDTPETIVYKINPKAVWSDGTAISADDFIYAWQTENGTNTKYSVATTVGYDQIASVVGSDGGKTVTVTFKDGQKFADWQSLFGALLPAHIMKTLDADPVKAFNEGLTGQSFPKFSGGPYMISSFKDNDNLVLTKNPKWWGSGPHLDKVTFRILTDSTVEPQALANNEVQVIYPQPQVDLVKQVQAISGVKTDIGFGLIFEHYDLNLANKALSQLPLRKAIFQAVDREDLVSATVKQFSDKAAPLNNRMLLPGQQGYKDNVASKGLGVGDIDAAKKTLTDAGYKITSSGLMDPQGTAVPALRFRYTTGNSIRQQEGELLQSYVKPLGITLKIDPTDDLGGTLDKHDFDIIVFAWVGTPFPFSANRDIYITGGGSNYDSYSNSTVDTALKAAATELDPSKARDDLNTADAQISDDAVTLPLYQKPTFLAYYDKYGNINNNSTSVGITYNIQDWGIKKAA